ncbi:MAG: NAD-dependent epimerase/dehydratase family protein [Arenicella sp.]|nr:NAD-dependent epimerase/dehydratase family protein [Arenicella sp.]
MIVVTGAKGVDGQPLSERLNELGRLYTSVSRRAGNSSTHLQWDLLQAPSASIERRLSNATALIHCAPIWLLPVHFDVFAKAGINKMVVFSSTSVISKQQTEDASEQQLVTQLSESEDAVKRLCLSRGIRLIILRPPLIYGYGRDQNVSHIAKFITRFGFMVLVGKASGLRQPVHADDLVSLALKAIDSVATENNQQRTYNVAGKDVLSYRQMVARIFQGLKRPVRILSIPLWLFRPALALAAKFSKFSYTPEMATRMNQDMDYDYSAAVTDLNFSPQGFLEQPERDLRP